MTKEIVKAAYEEAQNDLKEKQIAEVKKIVTKTLEKIERVDKDIENVRNELKDLEEKKKILRMDIDDLKEGRLDRIAERQEKDEEAKKVSVVVIIKEKIIEREVPFWYWPYQVIWQNPTYSVPSFPIIYSTTSTGGYGDSVCTYDSSVCDSIDINSSTAKFATMGTYSITTCNGANKIINLR